ncbi:MAG: contractile injection system tape measure protein [Bacteroidota bacterium]
MHILHNITADWEVSENTSASGWESKSNDFFQNWFLPGLEKQLDRWDKENPGLVCKIDSLEIDAESLTGDFTELKTRLLEKFEQAFRQKIRLAEAASRKPGFKADPGFSSDLLKEGAAEVMPLLSMQEGLLHYLEKGWLPVGVAYEELRSWLDHTEISSMKGDLLRLVALHPASAERLLNLVGDTRVDSLFVVPGRGTSEKIFPGTFLDELFRILPPAMLKRAKYAEKAGPAAGWALKISLAATTDELINILAKLLWPSVASANKLKTIVDQLKLLILQARAQSGLNRRIELPGQPSEITGHSAMREGEAMQLPAEGILVQHAGLVLLHPFLHQFFREAGVLDTTGKKIRKPQKACHLLYFLACGGRHPKDAELALEKALLDIPPGEVIICNNYLTRKDAELCKGLLLAVLQHWTALKYSGIATLRDLFLTRGGNIRYKANDLHIEVEHLAQDILLNKLPWGLGMIKVPWREGFIHVNWQS